MTLEDREDKRFGNIDLILQLKEQHPEDRRSVWGDFLLQLRIDLVREEGGQWDLTKFLVNSTEYGRRMPKNAYEACELLITYGASRYYQKIEPAQEYCVNTLIADDMLRDIFPDSASALIRLFKWNKRDDHLGKLVEEPETKKSCIIL